VAGGLLVVTGAVLGAAGLVGQGALREVGATVGWVVLAAAPFVLIGFGTRLQGKGRDAALAARFSSALVVPIARTDESRIAFERLLRTGMATGHRLPSTCTAVITASGLEFWMGSRRAPHQILKVPSSKLRDVDLRAIHVNSLIRSSLIFDIDGPPRIELPLSPIGSGLFGYGPLSELHVRQMLVDSRRELGLTATRADAEAADS
jgi:hypothetical protein